MSKPTSTSESLLTEHLEYPPMSLIDDIINAANEIMYKCTQAMEQYLKEKDGSFKEIEIGTSKFETLFESYVDKFFDKLELYLVRNVLSIPQDLIDEGYFRLRHHDKLVDGDTHAVDKRIQRLHEDIAEQLLIRKTLGRQLKQLRQLKGVLDKYKVQLQSYATGSLHPVDETVAFLRTQIHSLTGRYVSLLASYNSQSLLKSYTESSYDRDEYFRLKTSSLLE